jgi:hypothetical protein
LTAGRDEGIKILYTIVRQIEDAEAWYDQKEAIRQIKRLAASGNPDAVTALDHLLHTPDLHPFLREVMSGMKILSGRWRRRVTPLL